MRYDPDADRPTYAFGTGADDDQPASPPEPPPQAYGYQGGEAFETAQTATHQRDGAVDSTGWGTFYGTGLENLEVPQTGTYWHEWTFTEFPPEMLDDVPDDITDVQEAPQPPSEPFTAEFFAA